MDDIASLDSTGKSWADMEESFDEPVAENPYDDGTWTVKKSRKSRRKTPCEKGMNIKCINCKDTFFFSNEKIKSFKERNLHIPKRCRPCINLKKKIGDAPKHGRKPTLNIVD